jgi:hypothetical protein
MRDAVIAEATVSAGGKKKHVGRRALLMPLLKLHQLTWLVLTVTQLLQSYQLIHPPFQLHRTDSSLVLRISLRVAQLFRRCVFKNFF